MSHETGQVRFQDGTIRFFEYNGTVEMPLPKLWETEEEVQDHWREERAFDRKCSCGHPPEDVEACTDYGTGLYWKAQACKSCGVIFDNGDPYDPLDKYVKYRIDGIPQWVTHPLENEEAKNGILPGPNPRLAEGVFRQSSRWEAHIKEVSELRKAKKAKKGGV